MSIDPKDERAWERKKAAGDRLNAAFSGFLVGLGMCCIVFAVAIVSTFFAVVLGVIFALCAYGTYLARKQLREGHEADLDILRDAADLLGPIGGRDPGPSAPKPPVQRADESEF